MVVKVPFSKPLLFLFPLNYEAFYIISQNNGNHTSPRNRIKTIGCIAPTDSRYRPAELALSLRVQACNVEHTQADISLVKVRD